MIDVMLCKKVNELPSGGNWIYEEKYDGGRVIAIVKDGKVKLFTRGKNNITNQFPEIVEALKSIKGNYIFDGELCIIRQNKCDFKAYQKRVLLQNPFLVNMRAKTYPATYFIFDILQIGDEDLTYYTLIERKKILDRVLNDNTLNPCIKRVFYTETPHFLLQKRGLIEGIVAKQKNSIYEPGKRSGAWVKYRFVKEAIVVATSYEITPSGIVAIDEAGHRITINGKMADKVKQLIDENGKAELEINYMEKTDDGKYRFPSFKRIAKSF